MSLDWKHNTGTKQAGKRACSRLWCYLQLPYTRHCTGKAQAAQAKPPVLYSDTFHFENLDEKEEMGAFCIHEQLAGFKPRSHPSCCTRLCVCLSQLLRLRSVAKLRKYTLQDRPPWFSSGEAPSSQQLAAATFRDLMLLAEILFRPDH